MSSKKTSEMGEENKSALVPRLRFPEFREADGWKSVKLKALTSVITKGTTPTSVGYQFIESGINFIKIESITKEGSIDLSKLAAISAECNETLSRSQLEEDDILFSIAGALGVVAVVKNDALPANTNQALAIVRLTQKDSLGFISAFLNSQNVQSEILKIKAGAAQPNISLGQLGDFDVLLPEVKEQQKIADCLSSLDELISAETQKLDALKTHKKGLMQQLFPHAGETVPRLRFPKFRGGVEWEACSLGDVIEEYREKSSSQDQYEVLTSARNGLVRQRDYYDNDRITERDNVGFNVIPPNYLTYRSRSDDRRFYFNENKLGITGIISTYYPVFRIDGGSNKFFIELLSYHAESVGKHSVGTSQTVLSLNELRRIKLPIPKEPEQQRIADCLSFLDSLITTQSQKIDALNIHKKGLMQQLFPSDKGE